MYCVLIILEQNKGRMASTTKQRCDFMYKYITYLCFSILRRSHLYSLYLNSLCVQVSKFQESAENQEALLNSANVNNEDITKDYQVSANVNNEDITKDYQVSYHYLRIF